MASRNSQANRQTPVPPAHDWRTTDQDEINRRLQRAREETYQISNLSKAHPVFSNFRVQSPSGMLYSVEIRQLDPLQASCECVDFRTNGLGLCKHVEAVRLHLQSKARQHFKAAMQSSSPRIEVGLDADSQTLAVWSGRSRLPSSVRRWFNADGRLVEGTPQDAVSALRRLADRDRPEIRVSQDVEPWLESLGRAEERRTLRREYELKVQRGEWPAQETTVPLFPYQREGMLHLAFTERALLADEMGLGKTIQAIAACALLHRLGKVRRALIVTPASLKSEWEEQIRRFTPLQSQVVFGSKSSRLEAYRRGSDPANGMFFTIVNYEQIIADVQDVNAMFQPDVVVLDEAQRIKNWNTRTARQVKRLRSRYAFVLSGTPIENRIDELHSLLDFLDPSILGPLFRFNREFYEFDERGRPLAVKKLDELHRRVAPVMLRRLKAQVETELPARTDHHRFVKMSPAQLNDYAVHEMAVSALIQAMLRRPLRKEEQDRLQRELAMMRMVCDTTYILNPKNKTCPKLDELQTILEQCVENQEKAIVFSEWTRMLDLVRERCDELGIGTALHTGKVPQQKRREEINRFKNDPECRVFLTSDSGATGLNLQNASVVVNCDLPWNPAKLEQRIARAWRKNQTRPVTVFHLISEGTIEHRMLETLDRKQAMSTSVLDRPGEVTTIRLRTERGSLADRLSQLMGGSSKSAADRTPVPARKTLLPADPAERFGVLAAERINGALVRCEEWVAGPGLAPVLWVVVDGNIGMWQGPLEALRCESWKEGGGSRQDPPPMEVVDRATMEAIERLINAGVLAQPLGSRRSLVPGHPVPEPPPLSEAERTRATERREFAKRRLKAARALGAAELAEEARPALLDAILALGSAHAIERRLAPPESAAQSIQDPLANAWGSALPELRIYLTDVGADWEPAASAIASILDSGT